MARARRNFLDGGIYHILNRGNGKQDVFLKSEDYQSFVELLKESKERFSVKLYAYCVMPNHFHFVAECPKASEYSPWMQWLTTAHVRRYHKHYGGNGHIWQGRFKSFLIQRDEYLLMVMRYVEVNPLRAGLVDSSISWKWSSCAERLGKAPPYLLDTSPIEIPRGWGEWVDRGSGTAVPDPLI